jgi:hypothetical protein
MEELKQFIQAMLTLIPALGGLWILVLGGLGLASWFALK